MKKKLKAVIIGAGNIGTALADGLVASAVCSPQDIVLTRRNIHAAAGGYSFATDNRKAAADADIIFLCVLPQQLNGVLAEIKDVVNAEQHLLVSVVTGVPIQDIAAHLDQQNLRIIRAMPNTALRVKQSMTCIAAANARPEDVEQVTNLFNSMGTSLVIKEELMSAATALGACGIAFFLRSIRAAAQGGVEIGFHAAEALAIASQTAKGAASLLLQQHTHPEAEIDKVTSPKGCTIAGLNEMEHQGLSSAMIKGIKLSAHIAGNLYKS